MNLLYGMIQFENLLIKQGRTTIAVLRIIDQGNFTQAMSDYNKAIEINPNYAEAYNNRGIIYDKQGNFTQAMSDYNKAIEINPKLCRGLLQPWHYL